MANSPSTGPAHGAQDAVLWESLKSAIAASSGFQSWQAEQTTTTNASITNASVEQMVRLYLRETLETLAY